MFSNVCDALSKVITDRTPWRICRGLPSATAVHSFRSKFVADTRQVLTVVNVGRVWRQDRSDIRLVLRPRQICAFDGQYAVLVELVVERGGGGAEGFTFNRYYPDPRSDGDAL